jgi:cyclopropane fatty-acyl-phospholipid synthase-like methyltransferase
MADPAQRIIGLYDENAEAWDGLRGSNLQEKEWLDRFLGFVPPGGSILDIGCGSGEPIARYLIERGFRVTGIDSSPSLIGICKKRFHDAEWLVSDMRTLDLGRSFDGVLAWHSFFHLTPEDQRPMFARFAAHAKEGAPLMFTSGPRHGVAMGEWQGEPLYHASLAPEEYRSLLAASGFEVESYKPGEPVAIGPSVWMARQMSPASGLDGSA